MALIRPKTVLEQRDERLNNALSNVADIDARSNYFEGPDEEFDYLKRAEELAFRVANVRQRAQKQRLNSIKVRTQNVPTRVNMNTGQVNGGGGGNFRSFVRAIAGKESGGNYGAVNPHSGALGKYQIMPANIEGTGRGWDYEILGKDISTQQFLNNPKLQERIARGKLRKYYQAHGAAGAASAWYSGDPNKVNSTVKQGQYPSIHAYVQDILRRMG